MARAVASRSHCVARFDVVGVFGLVAGGAVEPGLDRGKPISELDRAVLERARRDRIEDQRPGAERAAQGPRHCLHCRAGGTEDAGVAVGLGSRQLRRTTATIPHIECPV